MGRGIERLAIVCWGIDPFLGVTEWGCSHWAVMITLIDKNLRLGWWIPNAADVVQSPTTSGRGLRHRAKYWHPADNRSLWMSVRSCKQLIESGVSRGSRVRSNYVYHPINVNNSNNNIFSKLFMNKNWAIPIVAYHFFNRNHRFTFLINPNTFNQFNKFIEMCEIFTWNIANHFALKPIHSIWILA